jgi:hypothetical protein
MTVIKPTDRNADINIVIERPGGQDMIVIQLKDDEAEDLAVKLLGKSEKI